MEITEGDKLVLDVAFSGKPDPNVEWYFNGQVRYDFNFNAEDRNSVNFNEPTPLRYIDLGPDFFASHLNEVDGNN